MDYFKQKSEKDNEEVKGGIEEDKKDSEESKDLKQTGQNYYKMCELILKMIGEGLNIKIIYVSINNLGNYNLMENLSLKCNEYTAECEYVTSSNNAWFSLSKHIENLDTIHLFSSEKQRAPEMVRRFLKEKDSTHLLKIHYTGSSFEGYASKVYTVLSSLYEGILNSENKQLFCKSNIISDELHEESNNSNKDSKSNSFI